jgi:hypothetical protein
MYWPRNARAEGVSRRESQGWLVQRPPERLVSPVVIPATTCELPSRLGEPESPVQISAPPFIRRRSQPGVSEVAVCRATFAFR